MDFATKDTSPKKSSLLAPGRQSQSHSRTRSRSIHTPGSALRGRLPVPSSEERPGRFEEEFVEVDELGQGEFGRVMKARYKTGSQEVFAVKKCKRFEGVKHRLVFVCILCDVHILIRVPVTQAAPSRRS